MSYEVELKPNLFVGRYFSIDENSIIYHDTEMVVADIVSFAYGEIKVMINRFASRTEYGFSFKDNSGDEIKFTFYSTVNLSLNTLETYNTIVKNVWECFGNRIMNEMIQAISNGRIVEIKDCKLSQDGIEIPYRPFIGEDIDYVVPWEDLTYESEGEFITIKSESEPKAKIDLHLNTDHHAQTLKMLIDILYADKTYIDVLSGKKLN